MKALVIKLEGYQAWGESTLTERRPSSTMPTRSGLLGLLAACLGIRRHQHELLSELSQRVKFAIRADQIGIRELDYHTVRNVGEAGGGVKKDAVQSYREYLSDCKFTVLVIGESLTDIKSALKKPVFTPFMGRKSCPITRPLYYAEIEGDDVLGLFQAAGSSTGQIASELPLGSNDTIRQVREQPVYGTVRKFANIEQYIGGLYVSK